MSALPIPAEGLPGLPPGAGTVLQIAGKALLGGGKKNEPPPGYRANNWVQLKQDSSGFSIGSSEVPDMAGKSESERNAIVLPFLRKLEAEYDPAALSALAGHTVSGAPGSTWMQLTAQLFADLDAAGARRGAASGVGSVIGQALASVGGGALGLLPPGTSPLASSSSMPGVVSESQKQGVGLMVVLGVGAVVLFFALRD